MMAAVVRKEVRFISCVIDLSFRVNPFHINLDSLMKAIANLRKSAKVYFPVFGNLRDKILLYWRIRDFALYVSDLTCQFK